MPDDPLDDLERESLAERLAPYRAYGDDELATALLTFADQYGSNGLSRPADAAFTHYCEGCEKNVRGVSTSEQLVACPICGEEPGMLELGRGPQEASS